MPIIVIKDLPENIDLDRQAMSAITGGARTGGRPNLVGRTILRSTGITHYPFGSTLKQPTDSYMGSVIRKPLK